ncbi:alpha-glucosidase [Fulvivirgaceae bacterium BMA12]|uniref:Alpha-glucosidase n=1 Tax=Agaribacillus aureus TaxID=3051825 RepID=A0ABT8LK99_9BACT|nr:alpha-glucosidase [Fulvivirgaceae bacterium BMA12]
MNKTWWKESVVYQIYPRSFNDANNDGIGDLRGIIQKIDYIKSLGVDVIWLCPIYQSPNDDNGYDISDYTAIMTEFGTMADFDELLDIVHRNGLKLILDLVLNHTSIEHPWFLQAKKSKDNPYRGYYHWRKGGNGHPPNNWPSFFKGSVWEFDESSNEYYLHLFSKKQPDLNWENPAVRQEIHDLMRFWLNKGIDGFRMDAIPLISKDTNFPDTRLQSFNQIIDQVYANGPRVHEFIREIHDEVLSDYDVFTVGEGPGISPEVARLYTGMHRKELNTVFHFGHLFLGQGKNGKYDVVPWTLPEFKNIFAIWDKACADEGWNSIFLGNHDFSRMVSRFGNDGQFREQSAKLLAMLLLSMRGTVFLYQGDEIGMTNVAFHSIDDYHDIETVNSFKEAAKAGADLDQFLKIVHDQSRDNARTPMQWDRTKHSGFSAVAPWINCNPNYMEVNVTQCEANPHSVLNFYRRMIKFRKEHKTLVYGQFNLLYKEDPDLFVYERFDENNKMLVVLNFSDKKRNLTLPHDGSTALKCLISNYNREIDHKADWLNLEPWEANIYKI